MKTSVSKIGEAYEIVHEPGNATRYHIIVTPLDEDHACVAWPESNVSMIAANFATLDCGYFHEKLNRSRKYELSEVDCSEVIRAVQKIPMFKDCPIRVCTDLSGHYQEARYDAERVPDASNGD